MSAGTRRSSTRSPSDRLLVWNPADGWEPLCELLDLPVPSEPLANVNDTESFQKNLIMRPAIEAINRWWDENQGPADTVAARPTSAQA